MKKKKKKREKVCNMDFFIYLCRKSTRAQMSVKIILIVGFMY